jgi:hypothetical protein
MSAHTPGPWGWFGNTAGNRIYLATQHHGRRYVMDFTRWGMRGAQPRFQCDGLMVDGKELVRFAVGDRDVLGVTQARQNTSVYRQDIIEIDHPDARLICAAPDQHEALTDLLNHYVALVNSGDAGSWDPEKEPVVIKARAAIAKAQGGQSC